MQNHRNDIDASIPFFKFSIHTHATKILFLLYSFFIIPCSLELCFKLQLPWYADRPQDTQTLTRMRAQMRTSAQKLVVVL